MTMDQLPDVSSSYWQEKMNAGPYPKLDKNIEVDVAIVGAGITGITAAYLLVNEGYKVALLDASKVINGTTGHTTAKVTAQHGLIYDEFIKNIGRTNARLYYEANAEALQFIEKLVEDEQIDCDFSKEDSYIYATTDEYAHKLKLEASAYEKIGIDGKLVDEIPFAILIKNALMMKDQAQFHPIKYLTYLLEKTQEKGGLIFEQTVAVNVKTDEKTTVLTKNGAEITCNYVLSCSHFPFYEGVGVYSSRLHADRSYVLCAKTKQKYPGGMYVSVDEPNRSLRSVKVNGEEMVLIVGESHKTGQGKDTMTHYKSLESFGEDVLGLEKIAYRWSTQDLITIDKLPYIGALTDGRPNILIATGYRKWGMTNGTAAALLFKDIVLGKENKYANMYSPSRFYMNPSLKNFLKSNADVVKHLIKGKLEVPAENIKDIREDEAAVITIDGERKGAYKDKDGHVHIVDTTCTHVGCEVEWNNAERSWDCPCHGSRFSYQGEVLEGPAEKPLQKYDYRMLDNLFSKDSGY